MLQIGDKIVVLSKNVRLNRANTASPSHQTQANRGVWIPPKEEADAAAMARQKPPQDHRLCSLGPRSHFKRTHPETSESSSQDSSSDTDEGAMGPPANVLNRSPRSSAFHKSVCSGRTASTGSRPNSLTVGRALGAEPMPGPSGLHTSSDARVNPGASPPQAGCVPLSPGSHQAVTGRTGMPSVRPNAMRNRQKQLETLKYYESKIKQMSKPQREVPEVSSGSCGEQRTSAVKSSHVQNPMYVHVLDVSKVLREHKATWQPIHECVDENTPEETIFHSLVEGRGEIIMFGGIQMDLSSMQKGLHSNNQHVSNSVHFIRAVKTLR